MKTSLWILIILVIVVACEPNANENEIPTEYYNIPVYRVNHKAPSVLIYDNFFGKINQGQKYELFLKCTNDTNYHKFDNNNLEIEFGRQKLTNEIKYWRCFIGVNHKNKAYFMFWNNKENRSSKNLTIDSSIFKWDIFDDTDSLLTNLDLDIVKMLYPSFRGKHIKMNIKGIYLDFAYSTYDILFYNKIRFDGLDLGFPYYMTTQIDSIGNVVARQW